ncbi:MAG: peptide deformylase [Patescibacteria group bacterium]
MPKLKIVTGKDNPILRAMSTPVKKFDASLKKFAKDLKDAMVKAKGLGIAAPQVGQNIRVFITVLNYKTDQQVTVTMVNPEILEHGLETNIDEEGCLSLPAIYGKVERFNKVLVKFFDLDGNEQVFSLQGLNARVVQHENDHINGVLFIDRIAEQEQRKGLAV